MTGMNGKRAGIGRLIVAVIAGAATWAVLWVAGMQLGQRAFPGLMIEGEPLRHTGILVGLIVYSVVLSVLAGFVTGVSAARAGRVRAVLVLCALQLGLGIAAEASYWALMPVWYHVVFLILVVPATLYGGQLGRGGVSATGHARSIEPGSARGVRES